MNAFMMASLLCVLLLRPLGNPAVMYADVMKNPISEISMWELLVLTLPLILWSTLFMICALFALWTIRYERATVRLLAALLLYATYVFGTLSFMVTVMQFQFTFGSVQMNVALFHTILAYLGLPCISIFTFGSVQMNVALFHAILAYLGLPCISIFLWIKYC